MPEQLELKTGRRNVGRGYYEMMRNYLLFILFVLSATIVVILASLVMNKLEIIINNINVLKQNTTNSFAAAVDHNSVFFYAEGTLSTSNSELIGISTNDKVQFYRIEPYVTVSVNGTPATIDDLVDSMNRGKRVCITFNPHLKLFHLSVGAKLQLAPIDIESNKVHRLTNIMN